MCHFVIISGQTFVQCDGKNSFRIHLKKFQEAHQRRFDDYNNLIGNFHSLTIIHQLLFVLFMSWRVSLLASLSTKQYIIFSKKYMDVLFNCQYNFDEINIEN